MFPILENTLRTERHTSFYLSCGPADGPVLVFVHGWPELAISWRHQLPCFAALGFRCIAPDMRGYGRSSVPPRQADYALEHSTRDMIDLLAHLGAERAIWVGHDWGAPVVWSIASHHPELCHGVASLCVPHIPDGFAPETLLPLIDRALYPEAAFPYGQWDYQLFYRENFAAASAAFEANVRNTVKVLFRKGSPDAVGKPARTALVRRNGGWFGPGAAAPDVPLDADVLSEADLHQYVAALTRTGFTGADSWYMNAEANRDYARRAPNAGRIVMPVLFLHAAFDTTCDTVHSRLADPMREACSDLEEVLVQSGHWMAQEQPVAVNAALAGWLARTFPELSPAMPLSRS